MKLSDELLWLNTKFMHEGFHSIRRSSRVRAGLSTDLTIEQVMMKSLKSQGGLTHGRGMSESVRLTSVKTMHKCATMHSAIASLTDTVCCIACFYRPADKRAKFTHFCEDDFLRMVVNEGLLC